MIRRAPAHAQLRSLGRRRFAAHRHLRLLRRARPGAARAHARAPRRRWPGGSAARWSMGTGIWSMHFVGMLALPAADRAGLHRAADLRLLAGGGGGVGASRWASPAAAGCGRAPPGARRAGDGRRHLRHALHRHGGAGHGARHRLGQPAGGRLGADRGRRLGRRADDLLLAAQPSTNAAASRLPVRRGAGDGRWRSAACTTPAWPRPASRPTRCA